MPPPGGLPPTQAEVIPHPPVKTSPGPAAAAGEQADQHPLPQRWRAALHPRMRGCRRRLGNAEDRQQPRRRPCPQMPREEGQWVEVHVPPPQTPVQACLRAVEGADVDHPDLLADRDPVPLRHVGAHGLVRDPQRWRTRVLHVDRQHASACHSPGERDRTGHRRTYGAAAFRREVDPAMPGGVGRRRRLPAVDHRGRRPPAARADRPGSLARDLRRRGRPPPRRRPGTGLSAGRTLFGARRARRAQQDEQQRADQESRNAADRRGRTASVGVSGERCHVLTVTYGRKSGGF